MSEFTEHDIAMMPNWADLRDAKGISLQQITEQTNIPVKKLAAIESHQFDSLGSETFALGYLRSYAKILGEDPETFIQVYRDASAVDPASTARHTQVMAAVNPLSPIFKKLNILHLSVGVIVLWVLAMFIMGEDEEQAHITQQESATGVAKSEAAPRAAQQQPYSNKYEDAIVSSHVVESTATDLGSEQEAETDEDDAESEPELSNIDHSSLADDAESGAGVADESAVDLGSEEDLLIFSFSDDCWLEVKDSSGSVLIAELQRKGDNQRVFGQPPFEVMLGNARAVTLTRNGNVVSVQAKPGKKTLRFSVPR
ncbi:MAG: DUF4115 domain-containing protein [Agarilytica sp.]